MFKETVCFNYREEVKFKRKETNFDSINGPRVVVKVEESFCIQEDDTIEGKRMS